MMETGRSDRCRFALSENQQYDSVFPAPLALLMAFILVQLLLTAAEIKILLQLNNIKLCDGFSLKGYFYFKRATVGMTIGERL